MGLILVLLPVVLFAQQNTTPQKFALVIGNGNYQGLARLANPANDAADVGTALTLLGFTVDTVLNANLEQMESAVERLKNRLSVSSGAYGFFFYAGHGVQSNGENYLIPVDADIPSETYLRNRTVSVQNVLDELNDSGNSLNVVILDACRDSPFGWSRGGSRGLLAITNQPADSIIVYATSAGQRASDGTGRNGLFTSQLLKNLAIPGLEVKDMLNRTGADVSQASGKAQIPAIYNQFFGTAYLGTRPAVFETGAENIATGSLEISTIAAGTVQITGADLTRTVDIPAYGSLPIEKINSGTYQIVIRYEDGKTETKTVEVGRSQAAKLDFTYHPPVPKPLPPPKPVPVPKPAPEPKPAPAPKPSPEPRQPKETQKRELAPTAAYLNALGVSAGTSFSAPWLIGTVQGAFAPWKNMFFNLGLDLGTVSGETDAGHFSLYPFIRYAFFVPVTNTGGWYAAFGAGPYYARYTFTGSPAVSAWFFLADISTGYIFGNGITLSYTLSTDFSSASNKVGVGYTYRFTGSGK